MTETKSKVADWLKAHVDYPHDFCLVWPFYRNPNGYGMCRFGDKSRWAHRLMCEMAHGSPPTLEHEAAHSCGNGDGGCCNPRHLSWKTPTENRRDSIEHGTSIRVRRGRSRRLSDAQVVEIKSLKGKLTQQEIADRYGISQPMVRAIFTGRAYGKPPKLKYWKPEEDAKLREALTINRPYREVAEIVGRSPSECSRRACRLGLRGISAEAGQRL